LGSRVSGGDASLVHANPGVVSGTATCDHAGADKNAAAQTTTPRKIRMTPLYERAQRTACGAMPEW
jgi:hypothetical protein